MSQIYGAVQIMIEDFPINIAFIFASINIVYSVFFRKDIEEEPLFTSIYRNMETNVQYNTNMLNHYF